jgi:transcriptional regulator with XRE-family HTH domain
VARRPSPTLRRRELGARLRELRQAKGLTVDEVAGRLLVSAPKVSRIETGAGGRGVNLRDVRDLCDLYEVDAAEREKLMRLARESQQRSWWQEYSELRTPTYVGLEASATSIQEYESGAVPPLLQIEDYARALVEGVELDVSAEQVAQRARARQTRQQLLTGEAPIRFWAVLDEAAVRRVVGGRDVMAAQLRAVLQTAALAHVTVQVIPFEAGSHPGINSTFILLHFEEDVPDVVYVEGLLGDHFLENPTDVDRYRRVFDQLRAIALSPKDSAALISALADGFTRA